MNPYFPGDAPGAEMLGILGAGLFVPVSMLLVVFLLLTRRRPRARLAAVALLALPMLLAVGAMGFAAVDVGSRHFGQWAQLKELLGRYSNLVAAEAKGPEGRLTPEQYRDIQARLLTPAPTFQFAGTQEPVRLRMMMTIPPYVGVDFGHGANAVFDLRTMWCIYSD
jgi:hypothetical protein